MPQTRSNNRFQASLDLAILTDNGLEEIALKCGVSIPPDYLRPSLIETLRAGGYDKFYQSDKHQPEAQNLEDKTANLVVTVAALKATVEDLSAQLEAFTDRLKGNQAPSPPPPLELKALQEDVAAIKAATVSSHGSAIIGQPHAPTRGDVRTTPPRTHAQHVSYADRVSYADPVAHQPVVTPQTENTHEQWSFVTRKRNSAAQRTQTREAGAKTGLQSAKRVRRSVFYVGGMDLQSTAEDVVNHCEEKGVSVTACRVFPSKRNFGTLAARLTIAEEGSATAQGDTFWPAGVSVRPWRFAEESN